MRATCTKCNADKELSEFYYYSRRCKACCREDSKRRRRDPSVLGKSLRKRYWPHLTGAEALAEYERLLAIQSHVCAICKKTPDKNKLSVDHCHKTGKIRGLLCVKCNSSVVPAVEHHEDLLDIAREYLRISSNAPIGS